MNSIQLKDLAKLCCLSYQVVRVEGLEPPRLAAPEPKSGASTNFATPAKNTVRVSACYRGRSKLRSFSKAFRVMRGQKCIGYDVQSAEFGRIAAFQLTIVSDLISLTESLRLFELPNTNVRRQIKTRSDAR